MTTSRTSTPTFVASVRRICAVPAVGLSEASRQSSRPTNNAVETPPSFYDDANMMPPSRLPSLSRNPVSEVLAHDLGVDVVNVLAAVALDRAREIAMDMGPGYAESAHEHAPQAIICIDPYHVMAVGNRALDEVRRDYCNTLRDAGQHDPAKRFKDARWTVLKNPEGPHHPAGRDAAQAQTWRRRRLAGLHPQRSAPRDLRLRPRRVRRRRAA